MKNEEVESLIQEAIVGSQVNVQGDGHHFELTVVSEIFADKTKLQQQQSIYEILAEPIRQGSIHAVSINCFTPEQWQEVKNG